MTDPVTPTERPDESTEAPEEQDTIETGAWMDERDAEPSASPVPPEA